MLDTDVAPAQGKRNLITERFTVPAADGFKLAAVRWLPAAGPVRAVLQLSHGMAEHKERYAGFAAACAAKGIAVYAHDHRGHGASVDSSTPLGHYADRDGWHKVVSDLHLVGKHARKAHPGAPVFLLGHSMGSFIARAYLVAHGSLLAGAIISATGFRMGPGNRVLQGVARLQAWKLGPRQPSALMAKLVFGTFNLQFMPSRTSFDWLSRDPETVNAYIQDPLCGFDCSSQLWADLLGGVYSIERAEADPLQLARVPILIVAGSRDPVSMGGLGSAQLGKRYLATGNPDVTVKRYPGGRHELLNEENRAEVWTDLLRWIEARIPASA